MKKFSFSLVLLISLLTAFNLPSQCCRGYLQLGGCMVLSGKYIKIGLYCSGNPNGWCDGEIYYPCSGIIIRPVGCNNVTFSSNFETNC